MFKRAVDVHEVAQASKEGLAKQLFPSSSPPVSHASSQQQQQSSLQFNKPPRFSQQSALIPSPPSSANAAPARPGSASHAIKRTSSGLTKALGVDVDSGFSDASESLGSFKSARLVAPGKENMPVKTIHTQQEVITLDEDDFDSDIDLDIEDPAIKPSIASRSPQQLISRPPVTSPKPAPQQRARMHTQAAPAQSPASRMPAQPGPPPNSSMPIPWSSSPAEHKMTPPKLDLQSYVHHEKDVKPEPSASAEPQSSSPLQPAPKRKALPWVKAESQEDNSNATSTSTHSKHPGSAHPTPDNTFSTPMSKPQKDAHFLWNTSASAVKQQQKQLRLMNRNKTTSLQSDVPGKPAKKQTTIHRLGLSQEQRHVMDLVVEDGQSVFFTGSAGTGKSVLLREIIAGFRQKYKKEQDRVAVTASTGLAACNIGGVTLHSFSGIGLGKEEVPELLKKVRRNQKAKQRWLRTKVLVVDEISMVDGDLFDKLEQLARTIRNNPRPFGGIQVVITGDFFQLPPVPEGGRAARFCFDANTWSSAIDHTIALHHVFRQKDPEFAKMLNEMREGRLSPASIATFRGLNRETVSQEAEISTTELFPTRAEVDQANNVRMRNLKGTVMTFTARDGGTIIDKAQRDRLLANCMAPQSLELKKGAQVMLIKNMDEQLVNGSLGVVRGFMSESGFDHYNEDPEEYDHLSAAHPDDLNPTELKKKRVLTLSASTGQMWPVIRFSVSDGCTRDVLCNPEAWKIELPNGEVQASRHQVPLILAWALSIHKAQGQTLERVKVDLGKVFERGQAYVALSRATTMAGLQVMRFDPSKVQAHERVRGFYAGLSRAEASARGQ